MRKFYFSVLVLGIGILSGCASGVYYETKPELPAAVRSKAIIDFGTQGICSQITGVDKDSEVYNQATFVNRAQLSPYNFDAKLFDMDVIKYIQNDMIPKLADRDFETKVINYCKMHYWQEIDKKYLELQKAAIAREREQLQRQQASANFWQGLNAFNNALDMYNQSNQRLINSYQGHLNQMYSRPRPTFQMQQNQRTNCINAGSFTTCNRSNGLNPVWNMGY